MVFNVKPSAAKAKTCITAQEFLLFLKKAEDSKAFIS